MEKNVPQGDPLVSIRCLVYNHEPYLRQCLDGFVMQQTTFPFEAIVHDDASTDGSAAIIREYAEKYPHIIKPIYETENQYRKHNGSLARILDAAMCPNSRYIALCEGDDYWTAPNKLQMQVDVMENNEEVGLVHSLVRVYDQQKGKFLEAIWGDPCRSFEDELVVNRIITMTTCFRKELFMNYRRFMKDLKHQPWKMGDYPIWLFFSYCTKTFFIDKPTGVYRLLQKSASHDPDPQKLADFERSALDIKMFFAKQFHYEHMQKDLATSLVYKLQEISLRYDKTIEYDLKAINRDYGLNHPVWLFVKHYILKNDFSRRIYLRYLKYRMGEKNE